MNTANITTAGLNCKELQLLQTLVVLKSTLDNRLKKEREKTQNFKIFWVS